MNEIGKQDIQFQIGDLVRLYEDREVNIGCGLVTSIKENLEDVYDLQYLRERIGTLRKHIPAKSDDFFSSRPQILVLWSMKTRNQNKISLWMYAEELIIISKIVQ